MWPICLWKEEYVRNDEGHDEVVEPVVHRQVEDATQGLDIWVLLGDLLVEPEGR